jgi:undecaprenyl pyrophosphate phosphatase UppP
MCYWCLASFLAWGGLSLIGISWYPLHARSAATICLAMAVGCAANWARNRTLHCAITAPVFLVAGTVFLLSEVGALAIDQRWVWLIVAIATGLAFLLEWRFAART